MKYTLGLLAAFSLVACSFAEVDESETSESRIIVADGDDKAEGAAAEKIEYKKADKVRKDGPNIPDFKAPAEGE